MSNNLRKLNLVTTDLAGLDLVLGGGIPRGSLIMLVGAPGTGKTILIQQICFNWAVRQIQGGKTSDSDAAGAAQESSSALRKPGRKSKESATTISKAIYFSTLSEPHDKLLEHIRKFDFYNETFFLDHIRLLSLTSVMEEGLQKCGDLIIDTARQENAGLIAIDGFRALEAIAPDTDTIRRFLYRLSAQLNLLNVTALISLERTLQNSASEGDLTIADGIIGMYSRVEGAREFNRLEVRKLRGMNRLRGLHAYNISQRGITVYPRLETLVPPVIDYSGTDSLASRLRLGLPELETMLRGGLPLNSSTLVAGSPGMGKTILSLHYLLEGARQGQKGLFISFHQSQQELINKSLPLGLDLKAAIADGLIKILSLAPVELEPDMLAAMLRQEIEGSDLKRLVLDDLFELERACATENRTFDYMAALAGYLKRQQVTVLYNYTISRLVGHEFDLGSTSLTALTENVILLRRMEYRSRFYQLLSILQMRSSDHERSTREFTIEGQKGITILPQPTTFTNADSTDLIALLDQQNN